MKLLSISDLCDRWNYSRQGIHNLTNQDNFPEPFAIVSRGRIKIYSEESIAKYEQGKVWLFDEEAKEKRIKLFALWQQAEEGSELRDRLLSSMQKNRNS
jgi:hypothetical protein